MTATTLLPDRGIRPSSLGTDCYLRWVSDNVPEIIERETGEPVRQMPTRVATLFGSATHAGQAELNNVWRITGAIGGRIHAGAGIDAAIESYEAAAADQRIVYDRVTTGPDDAMDQLSLVISKSHADMRERDHAHEPVLVEQGIRGMVGGVECAGTPDVWSVSGALTDYKTRAGRIGGDILCSYAPQPGSYSQIIRAAGYDVTSAQITHLPRARRGSVAPVAVYQLDLVAAEMGAVNRVHGIMGSLERYQRARFGDLGETDQQRRYMQRNPLLAIDANPASHLCSEKWCRLYGTDGCPHWKRRIAG